MIIFVAAQNSKGVVLTGEWLQFLTKLNSYTGTWGSAKYQVGNFSQLNQLTGMNGGDFAYEQDNGVLWFYNAFQKQWQKVSIVLS